MKNKNYSLTQCRSSSIRSFTAQFNEVVEKIQIECAISPIKKPDQLGDIKMVPVIATWDTGSGGCCITKEFANRLGLKSHRSVKRHYKELSIDSNCYSALISLPNGIIVPVELMEVKYLSTPLLIGMDIINKGDFFIKNISSKSNIRFEMPIIERAIDTKQSQKFKIEKPRLITEDGAKNTIYLKYGKIAKILSFECKVSLPFQDDFKMPVIAIWDTGTSTSIISKTLAAKLKVPLLGKTKCCSVNGESNLDVCLINIHLFNGSETPALVFIQDEDERHDLVLGMDIINLGSLSIKSMHDETTLLFEIQN